MSVDVSFSQLTGFTNYSVPAAVSGGGRRHARGARRNRRARRNWSSRRRTRRSERCSFRRPGRADCGGRSPGSRFRDTRRRSLRAGASKPLGNELAAIGRASPAGEASVPGTQFSPWSGAIAAEGGIPATACSENAQELRGSGLTLAGASAAGGSDGCFSVEFPTPHTGLVENRSHSDRSREIIDTFRFRRDCVPATWPGTGLYRRDSRAERHSRRSPPPSLQSWL